MTDNSRVVAGRRGGRKVAAPRRRHARATADPGGEALGSQTTPGFKRPPVSVMLKLIGQRGFDPPDRAK